MIETVRASEETQSLFVSVSDIPCIDAEIITTVLDAYRESGKDACSTWVPSTIVRSCRGGMTYRETIGAIEACPTGLNILLGTGLPNRRMSSRPGACRSRLAINVNTREDRAAAEAFLKKAQTDGNM